jgi:hypothetical protein
MRRQLMRMRGGVIGTIGGEAVLGLMDCVALLSLGAWLLSVDPVPGLSRIVGCCAILVGAIALINAARKFVPALRTSRRLRNQGDARDATEREAQQAARGGGRSSADDRRMPD